MKLEFGIAQPLQETPGGGSGGGGTPSGGTVNVQGGGTGDGGTSGSGGGGEVVQHEPIPWDQHEPIRTRAEKLAWAEQYDPERVKQSTHIYDWLDRDPAGAHAYITNMLRQRGHLQPERAPRQPEPHTDTQTGEPLPDIQITETGQRFYSADQARKHAAWSRAEVMKEIDPLKKFAQGTQTSLQAQQDARAKIAEAESWDGFTEHAKEIYAELQRDKRLSLEGAYIRIVPKQLRMKNRQELVTEMRTKANAGTHNPASGGTRQTEDVSKVPTKELMRRAMQKRGIG